MNYAEFLERRSHLDTRDGFKPTFMPSSLFDFQAALDEWAIEQGRCATLADCGMGKTIIQLVWAENVVRHTNRPVLVLTPLAVGPQTVREGEKFGIDVTRSLDGKPGPGITVANYERLHLFDPNDFAGMVCDESSILKSFDGVRRGEITAFMRKLRYRLLCTATAAPNDFTELGTSSEALGYLGHMDMLNKFFKNDQNTSKPMIYRNKGDNHVQARERAKWRFKGHAEEPFWRWVCSWARAVRKPSDLGFDDGAFIPHKTIVEDSSRCSVASADYLLVFRRKGKNPVPITHPTGLHEYAGERAMPAEILKFKGWTGNQIENRYSHWIWRNYASAFWDDIRIGRVLPFRDARDEEDEKHVHPLQLDVIERCLHLWSNPGETVLTPFMGVGSEVFAAVRLGRRGVGIELKPSYYRQALKNLAEVDVLQPEQAQLFENAGSM